VQLTKTTKAKSMRVGLKLTMAVGCSLVAVNASWASLTSINVTTLSGVSGISSAAYLDNSVLVVSGSPTISASSTWAGALTATIMSGPTYGSANPFLGFCTDLANRMPNGTYNYEAHLFTDGAYGGVVNPETGGVPPDPNWADSGSGQRAAWIYNTYASTVNSAALRGAMCIAIWEALYEGRGTFDVTAKSTSGRSFASSGGSTSYHTGLYTWANTAHTKTVAQQANEWLAAGVGANWAGFNTTWWAEQSSTCYGDVQSLIGPVSAVPEPTTMLAGALLLLPFGMSTLRVLRKSRTS
jgi:hypothetical protein